MGGGNFLRSFVSGAAASAMGSYAQIANIGPDPMVESTMLMGGVVAWATGGDFLQGAMRGMTIGKLNHAMHDGNGVITYSHDPKGNISGEISEVVVTSSRYTGCALIEIGANVNAVIDGMGASLKKNGGNSTFGSNHHFYWHTASERGFYGNQYISTMRLTTIGQSIVKYTGPVGNVLDGGKILKGIFTDIQDYRNGYTNGYNTVCTTSEAVGGWVGAEVGAILGAKVGMVIGPYFAGVGIVPATIICGAAGGILGSLGGNWLGMQTTDLIYGF